MMKNQNHKTRDEAFDFREDPGTIHSLEVRISMDISPILQNKNQKFQGWFSRVLCV